MSKAAEAAPLDELTGLPLPIYYGPEHDHLPKDFHHGWHSHEDIKMRYPPVVSKGLRASRGYVVPREFHGGEYPRAYHTRFKKGVELPRTNADVFQRVALGVAGVVPRKAIDLRYWQGYRTIELDDQQHAFLADPSRTQIENARKNPLNRDDSIDNLRMFVAYVAIERMLIENQAAADLTEILNDPEIASRRELGRLMYHGAIEALDDLMGPVQEIYSEAQAKDMIPGQVVPLRDAVLEFIPENRFGDYCHTAMWNYIKDSTLQTEVRKVKLQLALS